MLEGCIQEPCESIGDHLSHKSYVNLLHWKSVGADSDPESISMMMPLTS